jgi:hypothetical protein
MLQVNAIRRSLALLARDSTAVGLPQPHLNRTGLCELPDFALEPAYVAARENLREHLHASARPKRLGAREPPLSGAGLADLVQALVQVRSHMHTTCAVALALGDVLFDGGAPRAIASVS